MVGAVIGAAVSIGGSLLSASKQSSAAKKAANIQAAATQSAIDAQNAQAAQARQDNAPFLDAGKQAQYQLSYLLGNVPEGMTQDELASKVNTTQGAFGSLAKPYDGTNYQDDPAYQARLTQGQQAIERSAAAKGGLLSGATQKALNQFAQSVASDEYANAYNRYVTEQTNLYNSLAGQAGLGSKTASLLATSGQDTTNQISDLTTQGANANAAGTVASSNAWASGLGQATGALGSFFKGDAFSKWLNG